MHTIDVDFDIFKQLISGGETESIRYQDVIRELLGFEQTTTNSSEEIFQSISDWVVKGVKFPATTEFRAHYKGQLVIGRVENGALVVNGVNYDSPSAAAVAMTGNAVNGWRFWECRLPGDASWRIIESLRK